MIGLVLFAAATFWISWRCLRTGGRPSFSASRAWRLLTLQWMAFFLLPTQVHERYLAPVLVSMILAVIIEPRWWWIYLVLSLSVLLNVIYMLPGVPELRTVVRTVSLDGALVAIALVLVAVILLNAEISEGRDDAPQ